MENEKATEYLRANFGGGEQTKRTSALRDKLAVEEGISDADLLYEEATSGVSDADLLYEEVQEDKNGRMSFENHEDSGRVGRLARIDDDEMGRSSEGMGDKACLGAPVGLQVVVPPELIADCDKLSLIATGRYQRHLSLITIFARGNILLPGPI